ncbi:MAG TPA: rod shape-determining protein MreC [Opitutaceae bacterium]|nr:rod shape-determining protein MreC [Opitutaceae bacterium]
MPKLRFDQARPFLILGIFVGGWLILPLVVKSLLRASFFEIQAPMIAAASYVRDLQDFWSMRTRSKDEMFEAGRDLARINASYQLSVQQLETLRAEISRLEDVLRLPSRPEFRFEVARVAQRDFGTWWQRLVIRKGRNHGITLGAPVVFAGGVVGRISEVHAYTSVVDLLSSPTMRLSATTEGDTRPFAFQGGPNPPFHAPRGSVEFVPLDLFATAAAPQKLVTTGLGGVFPPGLVIGKVIHLEPSTDGLFKTGSVEIDPRINDLAEVTVLIPISNE